MPLQNRVLPSAEIVIAPTRGCFTGNRGILHDGTGQLGVARWRHKHWVICTLTHPRGTYHGPMPARGWTALFFLDEAVALSAGHRPCNTCRRAAYRAFTTCWSEQITGPFDRQTMDGTLHRARMTRDRSQVTHRADLATLPNGTFVLADHPCLIWDNHIYPYQPDGYGPPRQRALGDITVLTPKPTVAVLRAGYKPVLHPSLGLS